MRSPSKSTKPKKSSKTLTTKNFSKESLTNVPETAAPVNERPAESKPTEASGLEELRALEAQLQGPKSSSPETGTESRPDSGGTNSLGSDGAGQSPVRKRRKFKRPPPENTIRLTIRQYWRFRDWMARRQLGLPAEYAGVFIQNQGVLVEPLVEPVIGCLDAYLPEEWVVFIEDNSPALMLLLAIFEAEQSFAATVSQAAGELKAKKEGGTQAPGSNVPEPPKMPSLNETVGKAARVTA